MIQFSTITRHGPAALLALSVLLGGLSPSPSVQAQGSRLESFFDDAQRFIERSGKEIERQLNKLDDPLVPPRAVPRVPLPAPNPNRDAPTADVAPAPPPRPEIARPTPPAPPAPEPPAPAYLPQKPKVASPPKPPAPARPDPYPARAPSERQPAPTLPAVPEQPQQSGKADPSSSPAVEASLPQPDRNPLRAAPDVPPPPPHPSQVEAPDWTSDDIQKAVAACNDALSGAVLSYARIDPIREGICGAPAPLTLKSVGTGPTVEIRPAATVTCLMAGAVAKWMRDFVQPAAREHLGSPLVSIRNVASYVCRNRYNAPGKRISEHAHANALDVASFKTEKGQVVVLLRDWDTKIPVPPPPVEKLAERTTAPAQPAALVPANSRRLARNDEIAEQKTADDTKIASDATGPQEPAPAADQPESEPTPESLFLRAVFDGACKVFGTTLGPESNEAHRDHFHFDMMVRNYGSYCE